MLGEEEDADVLSAVIWSLSQIGGEDVRTYLVNLLDQLEDEEQIAFLEEALDNLAFTEDLDRFDLMSYDPDEELTEIDGDQFAIDAGLVELQALLVDAFDVVRVALNRVIDDRA